MRQRKVALVYSCPRVTGSTLLGCGRSVSGERQIGETQHPHPLRLPLPQSQQIVATLPRLTLRVNRLRDLLERKPKGGPACKTGIWFATAYSFTSETVNVDAQMRARLWRAPLRLCRGQSCYPEDLLGPFKERKFPELRVSRCKNGTLYFSLYCNRVVLSASTTKIGVLGGIESRVSYQRTPCDFRWEKCYSSH